MERVTRSRTYKPPSKLSLRNGKSRATRASTNTGPSGMVNLIIDLQNNDGVVQRVHQLVIQRDGKLGEIHDMNKHIYSGLTHRGKAVEYFQNGVKLGMPSVINSLEEINEEVKIIAMLHDNLPDDGGDGKPDNGGMFCSRFLLFSVYINVAIVRRFSILTINHMLFNSGRGRAGTVSAFYIHVTCGNGTR